MTYTHSPIAVAVPAPRQVSGSAAPAVLWNRTNGRLTPKDIARTICDNKDDPIGIYMGEGFSFYRGAERRKVRIYAALSDVCDNNGNRLLQTFMDHARLLHTDIPLDGSSFEYAVSEGGVAKSIVEKVMSLEDGQRTGPVIPHEKLVFGTGSTIKEDGETRNRPWTPLNQLYGKGDFANADNGGHDSRIIHRVPYACAQVSRSFAKGFNLWARTYECQNLTGEVLSGLWFVRPVIIEAGPT